MSDPLLTLTTDFGEDSPYVAAVKGVILSHNPAARVFDLCHLVPPQDVWHGAFFLSEAVPYFPAGTIHVVIVDPGVGTERPLVYAELGPQRLLLPDNGLLTLLARRLAVGRVIRLADAAYWRPTVSHTFHGRDILAPAAGHLSLGLDPARLGPAHSGLVTLPIPQAGRLGNDLSGVVLFVDHFGNVITNIPADWLPPGPPEWQFRGHYLRRVQTYGQAAREEMVVLSSSGGWVELAVNQGDAARRLGLRRGDTVLLSPRSDRPANP
jgi:hypothetical protein